jgi:hypothetical protein
MRQLPRVAAMPMGARGHGRRYLVFCAQGFGDTLEATPLLTELRRLQPDATIDVIVTQQAPRMLLEGISEIVDTCRCGSEDAVDSFFPFWKNGGANATTLLCNAIRQLAGNTTFLLPRFQRRSALRTFTGQ